MVHYLLEVIVFHALFISAYQLWLRKETFFNVNRVYLISTALLAFILPFMQFEIFQNQIPITQNLQMLPEVFIGNEPIDTAGIQPTNEGINWKFISILLYAAGVLFTAGILFRKYQEISRYFRFKRKPGGKIITIPNSDAAFTFLDTIFIGNKITTEAKAHILAHEEVHVKHKHGVDLFLFEILRVVFWFNPLVYIYQNKVAELHEFIADAHATKKTEKKSYYNQLLNTAFGTQHISFINTFFNHSLIKKRISMLQKKSKSNAKWKYLVVLPLIAGILTYVGCADDNELNNDTADIKIEGDISKKAKITLYAKEDIDENTYNLLKEIEAKYEGNVEVVEGVTEAIALNEAPVGEGVEIIEVVQTQSQEVLNDVPFAVIDEVPTFPGCDSYGQKAKKECMSNSVAQFVNRNFNTNLGKELGLKGINRIYVRFKIDQEGNIIDVGSRGPHPKLEEEAIRVINKLPQMTPGKQRGQAVNVLYSLPIVFQVQ